MTAEEATKLANEADARIAVRPSDELLDHIRDQASVGNRGIGVYITVEEGVWLRAQGFKVTYGAPSTIEWP